MSDMDNIASENLQTMEDLISETFCICGHLLSEHFMNECLALDFNGIIWSACRCKNAKVTPFEIKLYVEVDEDSKAA